MKKLVLILILIIFGMAFASCQSDKGEEVVEPNTIEEPAATSKDLYDWSIWKYFAYDQKSREEAFRDIQASAEQGYIPAKIRLGISYFYGRGVKKNIEKSIEILDQNFPLLQKEAEEDTNAMYELGNCYIHGIGVEQNKYEGYRFMNKAATKEHRLAMETVGYCLMRGIGCEKSVPEAIKWFEKADIKGSSAAKYQLALFYLNGIGVKKDHKKAMEMLEKSHELGNLDATLYLGQIYLNGIGEKVDEKKAFEYFEIAARGNQPRAMYYLGRCMCDGIGTEQNVEKGLLWILNAAAEGDDKALDMLEEQEEKK